MAKAFDTQLLNTTFDLAIPIKNLRFPRPGLYMIAIHVNDEEIARRPLEVDRG